MFKTASRSFRHYTTLWNVGDFISRIVFNISGLGLITHSLSRNPKNFLDLTPIALSRIQVDTMWAHAFESFSVV